MALTADTALPWLIDVDVFEQAKSQTNWDTITAPNSSAILDGWKQSSGAQNDQIDFEVVLAAGTWDVELMYVANTDNGIISVQFDAVEKGTIDTYNGSATYNNRSSVTGIAVATTAKVILRLKMATKNASSSSYVGEVQHIQLRRTA